MILEIWVEISHDISDLWSHSHLVNSELLSGLNYLSLETFVRDSQIYEPLKHGNGKITLSFDVIVADFGPEAASDLWNLLENSSILILPPISTSCWVFSERHVSTWASNSSAASSITTTAGLRVFKKVLNESHQNHAKTLNHNENIEKFHVYLLMAAAFAVIPMIENCWRCCSRMSTISGFRETNKVHLL